MPDEQLPGESSLAPRREAETTPASRRRSSLTPEQRRFLATSRVKEEREKPATESEPEDSKTVAAPGPIVAEPEPIKVSASNTLDEVIAEPGEREDRKVRSSGMLKPNEKQSRRSEMHRAIVIIGALVLLGLMFYVGLKFHYWKYLLFSARNAPKLEESAADKFPGLSSDELVVQALEAERAGQMKEAAERFIAAKHKNLRYRGILFRVATIGYNGGDFDTADKLFERAIAFGENVDTANYYRGLIAVRRKDLAGAQRSFAAAAEAAPFTADYHYYLAEALRMNHQPSEAIPRYEHGALLARTEQDATVCRFKIRMARLEAADASKVREEILEQQRAGALSVDWLMTAAALHIREGRLDEATALIMQARDANQPGLFVSCTSDFYFVEAAQKHPRLAEVSRMP